MHRCTMSIISLIAWRVLEESLCEIFVRFIISHNDEETEIVEEKKVTQNG